MFGNKMSKIEKAVQKGKGAVLVKLLSDKDESVRLAAIDGAGKIKCNDATNSLINMLHDSSAEVRKHSALALGCIGDVHAKAHIANASSVEKNAGTKAAMQEALGKLKDF